MKNFISICEFNPVELELKWMGLELGQMVSELRVYPIEVELFWADRLVVLFLWPIFLT